MKSSIYLNILLTVIAVNLSFQTLQELNIIPTAHASETEISNISEPEFGLVPLNENGKIEVEFLPPDEIDVNITGIDTYDELDVNIAGIETSDELDVNIDEIGGGYVSNGGPIAVEID